MSSEAKRARLIDSFVCLNRKSLVQLCKRYKIRGYSKIKKCDLVKILAEYQSDPAKYPLAGRKTRNAQQILQDSNTRNNRGRMAAMARRGKPFNPRARPRGRIRRVIADDSSDSDMDTPIPLRRKR